MSLFSSDARFLGVDLVALWRDVRAPWMYIHQSPVLRWLVPQPPVQLYQVDGTTTLWDGECRLLKQVPGAASVFSAVELPDDLVLRREVSLPLMAPADTESALAIDAQSSSPFEVGDLVWGYAMLPQHRGSQKAELVLSSRKQVALYLAAVERKRTQKPHDEVWVLGSSGKPVILSGYGERERMRYCVRRRAWGYTLLAALAVMLIAVAVTPTVQLRLRAIAALTAHEALAQRAASVVQQRGDLMGAVESLNTLSEIANARVEPLRVLDQLTQTLPDDTALQSIKIQGSKLTISGLTSNASALMQLLGDVPGFKDVRAPTAATRYGSVAKELFTIELTADPQSFGVKGSTLVSPVASVGPTHAIETSVARPSDTLATVSPASGSMPSAPVSASDIASTLPKSVGGPSFGVSGSQRPAQATVPTSPAISSAASKAKS